MGRALFVLQSREIIDGNMKELRDRDKSGKGRLTAPDLPQTDDRFANVKLLRKLDLTDAFFLPQSAEPFSEYIVHTNIFP